MSNMINISSDKKKLIVYLTLLVATFAVYWQVNEFDFINFDDNYYVTENSNVQSGITLDAIRWALSTKLSGLWNPLVWLSYMFDYHLFGLKAGGYHLNNLVLHMLSSLLLFWLFHRMTGAIWKSAFVAALFALHPLHVESVAWVSERKDVLSSFFWMLTLCLYVYYTEKPVVKRYLPAICSFVLALMSKPMVVTLPAIMILLDYWPLKRFQSHRGNLISWQLKEKMLFFLLSAIFVMITFYVPDPDPDLTYIPLLSRLANAPVAFVSYLIKTFRPADMTVFYPFTENIPFWHILTASLVIITASIIVISMAKNQPYLLTGWFWFAISIAPVIGIIQISLKEPYAMADRYHYLPSTGIAIMLAWGIPSLIRRKDIRKKLLFTAGILFLAILSFITWKQCGYWKNSITLFNHALQTNKDNYLAYNNRGIAYSEQGRNRLALEDFTKTIYLKADYVIAYNNRGYAYTKLGQYQLAIDDYNKAIFYKPNYAYAYSNRAFIYLNTGNIKSGCKDAKKACDLGSCEVLKVAKRKGDCH